MSLAKLLAGSSILALLINAHAYAQVINKQVLPPVIPNARVFEAAKVISSGSITLVQQASLVDTEGSASSDDLTTVVPPSGIVAGQIYRISPNDAARSIVLKDGTGANLIATPGGADITLDDLEDYADLRWTGSQWRLIGSVTGGAGGGAEYETKTDADAATIPPTVKSITTLGYATLADNGGAKYVYTGACPGSVKAWHIDAGFGCFTLADKDTTFEVFGFSTSNTASQNDTAFDVLEEALAPASGLNLRKVSAKRDGTYAWGNFSNGAVALDLVGVNGVEIDFNNSSWPAAFSTSRRINFVRLSENAAFNKIHSIRASQPNYTSTASTGVDWFETRSGANNNEIEGKLTGGLQGYVAVRNFASPPAFGRVWGNKVRLQTTGLYYGIANQSDGDYESYEVSCEGNFRCVLANNATTNDYRIVLSNVSAAAQSNQVVLNAYGHAYSGEMQDFTGHKVHITHKTTNYGVTPASPMVNIVHLQYPGVCAVDNSYGTRVQVDITFDLELGADTDRYQQLVNTDSYTCSGGAQVHGAPANGVNTDEIIIRGTIKGALAGSSNAFEFGSTARGYNTSQLQQIAFKNFAARDITQDILLGTSASVVFDNVRASNIAVNFQDSPFVGGLRIVNSRLENYKQEYVYSGSEVASYTGGMELDGHEQYQHLRLKYRGSLQADMIADANAVYIRGLNALMFAATAAGGGAGNYLRLENTDLYPSTASTIDLGATQPFRDIKFTGDLYTDGNADVAISPTWGNDGTANSIGNGTLSGTARKIGNRVFFDISLTFGSTTTVGSSTMFFQLPSPFNGNFTTTCAGSVYVLDSGTGYITGAAWMLSGADKIYMVSSGGVNFFGATLPMTWATNDVLIVSGNCEL